MAVGPGLIQQIAGLIAADGQVDYAADDKFAFRAADLPAVLEPTLCLLYTSSLGNSSSVFCDEHGTRPPFRWIWAILCRLGWNDSRLQERSGLGGYKHLF